MFIAEQQMVAAAVGLQVRGYRPFASTFAAFFSRAYDFVRMAAISRAQLCLAGSHAGVSIGEDGPSQMALEDLAMFRAVHSSTVLYPSDPNAAAALVRLMADHPGIAYMRTTRGATPTIYGPDDQFEIGGSSVLRSSDEDQVTLIGAGVTLHEALKAADALAEQGIAARVIDLYSVKPVDEETAASGRRRHRRDRHRRGPLARGRTRRRRARRPRRGRGRPRAQAGGHGHAGLRQAGRARCMSSGSTPTRSSPPPRIWCAHPPGLSSRTDPSARSSRRSGRAVGCERFAAARSERGLPGPRSVAARGGANATARLRVGSSAPITVPVAAARRLSVGSGGPIAVLIPGSGVPITVLTLVA